MEKFLAYLPMIGGIIVAIVAVVMDAKQKIASKTKERRITQIIDSQELDLEEVVKTMLAIQIENQKKDKWIERVIGFMIGMASSLLVSFVLYYLGMK